MLWYLVKPIEYIYAVHIMHMPLQLETTNEFFGQKKIRVLMRIVENPIMDPFVSAKFLAPMK